MAIPGYETFMLPILQFAADGEEHSLAEAREALAGQFNLSEDELQQMLPSGYQSVFGNRVAWAKTYLVQADLLEATRRGHFQITPEGRRTLASHPAAIDAKYLERFPKFQEFKNRTRKQREPDQAETAEEDDSTTPEELLQSAYARIRADLESDLLARVKAASPRFFERLVLDLLLKMGYGGSRQDAAKAVGRSGDEGIDGLISEDRLGLDVIYLQAKRWEGTVGRPEVQRFVGALQGQRARKGVFVTTGAFSKDALTYVDRIDPKVILIDGQRLATLMVDFHLGVTTVDLIEIQTSDTDYFTES